MSRQKFVQKHRPLPEHFFHDEAKMKAQQFLAPETLIEKFEYALAHFNIKDKSSFFRGQMRYLIALMVSNHAKTIMQEPEFTKSKATQELTQFTHLQQVIEDLPEGVIVANEHMDLVVFNKAAENILGVGNENAQPTEWVDLYGCFKLDGTKFRMEELPISRAANGKVLSNVPMLIKNRTYPQGVYISVNAKPLIESGTKIVGSMVSFRDVTEQIKSGYQSLGFLKKEP